MYAVLIPIGMQKDFEAAAMDSGLSVPMTPECAHKVFYNQPIEKIAYEFFTERDFQKAKELRDYVFGRQTNTQIL